MKYLLSFDRIYRLTTRLSKRVLDFSITSLFAMLGLVAAAALTYADDDHGRQHGDRDGNQHWVGTWGTSPEAGSGESTIAIPAGAVVVSDPVELRVPALGDLAISVYLPGNTGPVTFHAEGKQTSYISPTGDFAGTITFPIDSTTLSSFFLANVEVKDSKEGRAIVTLGDSITDGTNFDTRHESPPEGKYVIQTEEFDLSAVQAVEGYKDLSEVERSFRELKDLIEMRPIHHHRPKRVRAHIFVAALAFLLARALEKKLKAAGVPMSSAQALEALRTMHVVDIRFGAEIRRGVTAGNHQARQIPAALGISDREPLQAQSLEKNAHLVTK